MLFRYAQWLTKAPSYSSVRNYRFEIGLTSRVCAKHIYEFKNPSDHLTEQTPWKGSPFPSEIDSYPFWPHSKRWSSTLRRPVISEVS